MVRLPILANDFVRDNKKRVHNRQSTTLNRLQSLKLSRIFAGSTKKAWKYDNFGEYENSPKYDNSVGNVMRRSRWLAAVGSTINV